MIDANTLAHFTGTMGYFYHPLFRAFNYTDGVKYLSDNGAAWFVTDLLSHLVHNPKVCGLEFVVVEWNPETLEMVIKDDDKVVCVQSYSASDLKVPVKLYAMDGVLMLASEY